MRLIVASTRAHQERLAGDNPDDKVVIMGDRVYKGWRFTEIVDETFLYPKGHWKRPEEWWEQLASRLEPPDPFPSPLVLAYMALKETFLQFGMDEAYPPIAIEAFEKLGSYLYPDKDGSKSKAPFEANTAGSPDSQK